MSGDPFRLAAPGHPYSVAVAASQVINQGRRLSLDLGVSRQLATTTAFVLDQIDDLAVVFESHHPSIFLPKSELWGIHPSDSADSPKKKKPHRLPCVTA